jgi:hypothetical protein
MARALPPARPAEVFVRLGLAVQDLISLQDRPPGSVTLMEKRETLLCPQHPIEHGPAKCVTAGDRIIS